MMIGPLEFNVFYSSLGEWSLQVQVEWAVASVAGARGGTPRAQ